MDDVSSQVFGYDAFNSDIEFESMYERYDLIPKLKQEKYVFSTNDESSNDYHHDLGKDDRYPDEDCGRTNQTQEAHEAFNRIQDRDLPPLDNITDSTRGILEENAKRKMTAEDPINDYLFTTKKQRVSPTPFLNHSNHQVDIFEHPRGILQSWSSGSLMSDQDAEDTHTDSMFTALAYEKEPKTQIDPKIPHCHYQSYPKSYSAQNQFYGADTYYYPSSSSGYVQHLRHEDRVTNFIGYHHNFSAASLGQGPFGHPKHMDQNKKQQNRTHSGAAICPQVQSCDQHRPALIQSYEPSDPHLAHAPAQNNNQYRPPMVPVQMRDRLLLLALPEDKAALSEVLCLVRENVEVFAATRDDVKAPAPGRKRPVYEGQVGLRCIHCRWATRPSDKVKRAVCFPSSLQRIYRTVIDMKLDHFKACKYVPYQLKMKLSELMNTECRSTSTTMQYMVWAAKKLGMADAEQGICFSYCTPTIYSQVIDPPNLTSTVEMQDDSLTPLTDHNHPEKQSLINVASFSLSTSFSFDDSGTALENYPENKSADSSAPTQKYFHGNIVLATPEDKAALTPLRCFLRENVCAFSASADDIGDRSTTSVIFEGQVGLACLHCFKLPPSERSNRSMCFPFTISRIYQAVADIQRFHLSECKMVPQNVKDRFLEYQSMSTKGSKGLATRQYWIASAKKIGLVDTPHGIRFSRDPSIPLSFDDGAGNGDNESEASPLVLPEDKDTIAEFLYLTMLQLKQCRFKEADRNKRRMKDVGCKGVECKHCAGLVDGRKFFWSSVCAVESNFVSVHTHMLECKMVPQELKDELIRLKALRREQTSRLKSGSQKAFFLRVWHRLHPDGSNDIPSTPPSQSYPYYLERNYSMNTDRRYLPIAYVTPSQATVYNSSSMNQCMSSTSYHHVQANHHMMNMKSNCAALSGGHDILIPPVPRIESIGTDPFIE